MRRVASGVALAFGFACHGAHTNVQAGKVDAAVDGGSASLCGWNVGAGDATIHPLASTILPHDQRAGVVLGFARFSTAADKPIKTALVVGTGSCDVLWNYEHYKDPNPAGPFASVSSSADWMAAVYSGRLTIAVALVDASGTPRYVNIVDKWDGAPAEEAGFAGESDTGRSVSAIEAFLSGKSIVLEGYRSADGETDTSIRVLTVVADELVVVASGSDTHKDGSPHAFEVSATKSDTPTIDFVTRVGHWVEQPVGAPIAAFGAPKKRSRVWNPLTSRFR